MHINLIVTKFIIQNLDLNGIDMTNIDQCCIIIIK